MSNNKYQESLSKPNSIAKTKIIKTEKIITNSLSSFVHTKPVSSKPNQKSK